MASKADYSNPQAGAGRPLPKKEADIFKNVVKHYEMKQYKKAIKQADTILKKFPNHGETLAMKGLTLNYMSKKEEAHSFVKEGLMNDMKSHVCWHVYGLLHRSDHDYNEAIKAYKQALRMDPQNLQILRDLSMLQIQMRDLHGFAVTRNSLLTLKPNAKINWMAFALARHMTGDLQGAVKVIDIYLGTLSEGSAELGRCYESSELALYKNSILAEIPNNYKETLDHLTACEAITVDRVAWLQKRAEYQLKLKDYPACLKTVSMMFDRGLTENYRVHSLLMCALLQVDDKLCDEALSLPGTQTLATMVPLSMDQRKTLMSHYTSELLPKYAYSRAVQRIPLSFIDEDGFQQAIDVLSRKDLTKGVPSLCSELHSFLWTEKNGRNYRTKDPADVRAHPRFKKYVEMVDQYVACLSSQSKFSAEDENEEPPSTQLWAWFLRAGLHELAGEYKEGLEVLEKCLEHTPTAVDVYELKARLLLSLGETNEAAEWLDKGRDLDRQDRYINNQTTKYLLKAGKEDEALKRISLFTRHEGNAEQNLFDMQCSWYELELAACLARKEEWGRSLKKYFAVVKHFEDFAEDQFDFHSYCLRKVTLRAYVSLLRFEDNVYGQNYFFEAAAGIIRIYLHLFDSPTSNDSEEPDYTNMTAAEKKKAKAIARKKKKQAEKKEAEMKAKNAENGAKKGNQKGGKSYLLDEDPMGKEYLKKDPLDEARKFSGMLARYGPKNIETWLLQYDVAMRRKKPLMALQGLFKARSIDPTDSELFARIVDFARKMDSFEAVEAVKSVISEDAPVLLEGKSLNDFVSDAAKRIKYDALTDLPFRTSVAKALIDTKSSSPADAAALITDGGIDARKVSVDTCLSAYATLQGFGSETEGATKTWVDLVKQRFPNAIKED